MKITAYPLYNHAVPLQAAGEQPDTRGVNIKIANHEALTCAHRQGWHLLCPYAFSVTWNGGPNVEDIKICLDDETAAGVEFVQSQLGDGLITFHAGYQFKTEDAHLLWVRGPINAPTDGIAALESLVDAAVVPHTVAIHWQFTRPHQTVRFAVGEPFATILPQAQCDLRDLTVEVMPLTTEADVDAYEQAVQQMLDSEAVQDVFQRMGAGSADAVSPTVVRDRGDNPANQWAMQLTDPPPVSCICPTYGRVELLEEAIESFLRQDYPGQKELIILNDYAEQTLVFDHPDIRIVNLPQRISSLGEKVKMAVSLAQHDLLFVWHDDDIYLPHRLSYSIAHLNEHQSFFKADKALTWNQGTVSGPDENIFHGGSCWRRELFNKVQGYPHINECYDVHFERLCRSAAPTAVRIQSIKPVNIYYLYRWGGTGSYHFSALGTDGEAYQQAAEYIDRQAVRGGIPQGQVHLQPQWKSDYSALVQAHLNTLSVTERETAEDEIPFPPPFFEIPSPPPVPGAQVDRLFRGDYPRKLSVILPAANESILLQRTVEQFAATLPDNSEIIVVDNGSTDGSSDFLLNNPCPNIHLIRTPEALGVSGARNRGLAEAQGEFIVFADAHIDVPKNWWQPLLCTLNQPGVGLVGPAIGVMGRPELDAACGQRIAESKLRVEWLSRQSDEPYPVPTLGGGFMAMRHDTLKVAGTFDGGMPQWGSEDLEICVRYWLLGYEVWVAPSVTILHYFRKSNPYKIEWGAITHNLLRVALLHLNGERLTRVLAALKTDAKFEHALTHAVGSDVWQKRSRFAARRVHDDDWYFDKFAESCPV